MESEQRPLQDISGEISTIHHQQLQDEYKSVTQYWSIYTDSYPPKQFDITKPIEQYIVLFKQASKKTYFKSIFVLLEETPQYYQIGINYVTLEEKLSLHDDEIAKALISVFQNFQYQAQKILSAASIVLHFLTVQEGKSQKKINLSIYNFPLIEMIDVKAHMVENFISVQAIVIKVQQVRLLAISMNFICFQCKSQFKHHFPDGLYSSPSKCRSSKKKQCKSRTFIPCKDKMKTIFIQRIKIQQIDPEGRVPRQMICELHQNQAGKIITGETVIISGLMKTQSSEDKDKKTQGIFTPFLKVNSLKQKKGSEIIEDDMKVILSMRKDRNIFYSLIKSFCPVIFGHQLVKAGLLLGLVGGSAKNVSQQTCFRQTSHILLLGDPGIGKSQLLKFAVQILPHSVYVSATSMSHSGLTVTVNKQNNQQTLQAGALILADNGICAIDEFDKASDSSSLLEVMQQQNISIAKAGILCQLKCRVGIIASANPINGCYNKCKTFMENTKISNAILSRFDLIFLMVDKPDPERDKKLTEHIMNIHNKNRKKSTTGPKQYSKTLNLENFSSLQQRYSNCIEHYGQNYSLQHIKKYLSYIKAEIHPTLSKQAASILKSFYLMLRQNNPDSSFQITNRNLQSLVRLSMARARIQCRNQVTEEDAYQVTQLMQESLFDSFEEMGYNINTLKNEAKKNKINIKKNGQLSLPKQRNLFINALADLQNERIGNIWQWSELIKIAKDLSLNIGDFYNFIERLNQDGILLQKGSKKYSFQGSFL